MKQNFFWTLPQTCGLIQTCLTSGLVFCSDVHYQLLDLLLRRVPFQIIPIQLNLPPVTFAFMHLADAFIQSDLQCIQVIHSFFSMCVPWESNPQPFASAANAMLYHWATGTIHSKSSNIYKQYEYSWTKFQLSHIRVWILGMELFKVFYL